MDIYKIIMIISLLLLNLYAKTNEKVILQLDWLHQFQFAGYYIAKEKGYFKDQGLDVSIKEYEFGSNNVEKVIKKEANYAVGKSSLIIDKLEGKDIVLLSAIYQDSPMVLISLKSSKINTVSGFKNKKVMMTPDARVAANINAMIISQGLKLSNITFQPHSFNLEDLINKKTDVMACYLSNEPFILEKKGIKFNTFNPNEYGFNFYGGILFTSKNELLQNPKRLNKMYFATLKGWKYAFENIEETAKLIFDKYNTQQKSLESLIYEGRVLKKLSKYEDGFLGKIDTKKIEEIKRLYLLLGATSNSKDNLEGFIYNPNEVIYSNKNSYLLTTRDITLISNDSYPPFTMREKVQLSGIEIDYWNLINQKLKIENPKIRIENSVQKSIKLIKNNSNFVKYSFSKKDKKTELAETIPITSIKVGVATLFDKPYISNLNEIKDKKIAIAKHSSYYEKIKKLYPKIEFIEINDLEKALELLSKEKVYAVVAKVPAISYHITKEQLSKIKITGIIDELDFDLKLVVNKENPYLLELLNNSISLIKDKEREEITNKYYKIVYKESFDFSSFLKFLIPLLIMLMIVLFNNNKLKKEIQEKRKVN